MDSNEIIDFIANAPKKTPVRVYLRGLLMDTMFEGCEFYGDNRFGILFCEFEAWTEFYEKFGVNISYYRVESDRRNSAVPLSDLTKFNARIEPGAIIRDKVAIGDNCVIMMGAVINIGAVIGERTMIDMNTVIGARAIIGKDCHIGAGTVIAGVVEPPSADPVIIGDGVVIGANAVVLEGVKVGNGAVIAAGSIVIADVEPGVVVAGVPARVIKKVDDKTRTKTLLVESLRNLNP